MRNLWKAKSKTDTAPKIEEYQFAQADEFEFDTEEDFEEELPLDEDIGEDEELTSSDEDTDSLGYAKIQSEKIINQAKCQAEEIISQAESQAEQLKESIRRQASEEGYNQGYNQGFNEGMQQGNAKIVEEISKKKSELDKQFVDRIDDFVKKSENILGQQLKDNLNDMRDLSIAIAEKVISISLKSSTEIIGKMIQTAVDKRKRREWAHVYISECDAKRITVLPPAMATALSELSDHVRIIPMADDESGTCIIECPDEIIDASAATQIQNIKDMLNTQPVSDSMTTSLLQDTKGNSYVSSNDSSSL